MSAPAPSRRERLTALAASMVLSFALFGVALLRSHREGDEFVHRVLVDQLARGAYTLRGTEVSTRPRFFAPYLYDRPVHFNPPLYNVALLPLRAVAGPGSYVLLSIVSTALCAALVYEVTRRRATVLASSLASGAFLASPIVYLVATKVWAEALVALVTMALLAWLDGAVVAHRALLSRAPRRALALFSLVLVASVFVKSTAVFFAPAYALAAYLSDRARPPRAWIAASALAPTLGAVAWVSYLALRNRGVSAAGDAGSRLANDFVAAMAHKSPVSLFAAPFVLDPLLLFAFAGLSREHRGRDAHLALAALAVLGGFSLLAWLSVSTFHNKYISAAIAPLAVLAGVGFDRVRARATTRARATALGALVLLAAAVLVYEYTVHVRARLAEVRWELYWTR